MREFFFCEKKNYAIVQSSKAIYSPQNGFLGFFFCHSKKRLSQGLCQAKRLTQGHSRRTILEIPVPDLIGSISGGDLLAVQGPCTHRWSLVWRTPRNDAGLLCLGCFELSPQLFNPFFISLSTGERIPGFLFPRVSWMTNNLDLAPSLCQVSVPLAALPCCSAEQSMQLLLWAQRALSFLTLSPPMGPWIIDFIHIRCYDKALLSSLWCPIDRLFKIILLTKEQQ